MLHEEKVEVAERRCAESVQSFVERVGRDTGEWSECGERDWMIPRQMLTFPLVSSVCISVTVCIG